MMSSISRTETPSMDALKTQSDIKPSGKITADHSSRRTAGQRVETHQKKWGWNNFSFLTNLGWFGYTKKEKKQNEAPVEVPVEVPEVCDDEAGIKRLKKAAGISGKNSPAPPKTLNDHLISLSHEYYARGEKNQKSYNDSLDQTSDEATKARAQATRDFNIANLLSRAKARLAIKGETNGNDAARLMRKYAPGIEYAWETLHDPTQDEKFEDPEINNAIANIDQPLGPTKKQSLEERQKTPKPAWKEKEEKEIEALKAALGRLSFTEKFSRDGFTFTHVEEKNKQIAKKVGNSSQADDPDNIKNLREMGLMNKL